MALNFRGIRTNVGSNVTITRLKSKSGATKSNYSIRITGKKADPGIGVVGDRKTCAGRTFGFLSKSDVWLMLRVAAATVALVVALALAPIYLSFYFLCYLRSIATRIVARSKSMRMLTPNDALTGQDTTMCNAIISVLTFLDGEVRREDMRDVMMRRVVLARDDRSGRLRFPSFTRHVATLGDYLVWRKDLKFDADDHVIFYGDGAENTPPPETEHRLKEIVEEICNTPMDLEKSGWQIVIVPLAGDLTKLTTDGSKSSTAQSRTCVVWRFHHSIADGVALTRLVVEQIAENSADLKEAFATMMTKLNSKRPSRLVQIIQTVLLNVYALLLMPFLIAAKFVTPNTHVLHGPQLTGKKLVEWSPAIDLQTVKDIKNKTKTTVNDVILSCLSGALRRYFLKHKANVPLYVMTVIPVTLQVPDKKLSVNNNFSFLLAKLPTLGDDAIKRLKQTKSVMDSMKNSPEILVNYWLIRYIFNVLPNTITRWVVDNKNNVTLAASNVPGPSTPVKVCGSTITQVVPFLPHRGRMGLTVSIFSYVGQIRMGISADSALMQTKYDIHCLIDGFNEELHELSRAVI